MSDLDLYHLLIQQMPLGTFDGADYIRLDAVWRVPHDGSEPTLIGPWSTWPLTTPARMLASERQLCEMQTALAQRDALIVRLTQELEAARHIPPAVAVAATGMEIEEAMDAAVAMLRGNLPTVPVTIAENRAAPPALDAPSILAARPADPDPELLPFDAENDPETPRRKPMAPHWTEPRPPDPEPWLCPVCGRDAFAQSVAHPDRCLDCAAKLRQAA